MNLFLDDTRSPQDVGFYIQSNLLPLYTKNSWEIARSYDEFVQHITRNGLPALISFDHDLGDDIAQYRIRAGIYTKRKARKLKKEEKSGLDCAKWLIDYCMDNKLPLPKYYVHSQNPVGKENIEKLLENFNNESL